MSRYTMCPVCGHRMRKIDDDTYQCEWCAEEYDEDEREEGCAACGNPDYPDCKYSCPLYDD